MESIGHHGAGHQQAKYHEYTGVPEKKDILQQMLYVLLYNDIHVSNVYFTMQNIF